MFIDWQLVQKWKQKEKEIIIVVLLINNESKAGNVTCMATNKISK